MSEAPSSDSSKLYTPRLLGLAASLYHFPYDPDAPMRGEARSQTCGSSIKVSVKCGSEGNITGLGMAVTACAIGQGSAALLAASAIGKSAQEFRQTLTDIEKWLSGDGPLPDWPSFDALKPALPHTGRHGALLIPWRAINDALSTHS